VVARLKKLCSRLVFWLGLVFLFTGCQTAGYYSQAIRGQCQVWNRQRPISEVIADPKAPDFLKERLRLVLEIRAFAENELKLPANGHYLRYADLGRRFVVWNVYAAPEFSLTPRSWWYPAVGRLDYRGYFSEAKAKRYAAKLAAQGFDVHVGGVTAYSTLGWFRDPVLNTFVHDADADLAELLFHELAHQRLFIPGDTDFNEAFATAVAEEGLRRWMESRNDPAAYSNYLAQVRRTDQFVELVIATRNKLSELYDTPRLEANSSAPAMRREKERILQELGTNYSRLRTEWGGRAEYDEWFERSLNNAQLNTVSTYYELVPAFRRLLKDDGNDLERFFVSVEQFRKPDKLERRIRLATIARIER